MVDFGSAWVTNSFDDTVSRVSTATASLEELIPVGDQPAQVMHEAGDMWVANQTSNTVSQIDPDTNEVVNEIPVGAEQRGIGAWHERR